ncbi:uncharacterized protein EI90DRAFT_3125718 [Cantharellus anzutake]|uniref:uncharacterized protein n=1 Tax=Cantharellus anzutake TaxID=1750568 RepID=UPI00190793A2|nr:uncharacterized protein EI90DRAFT_3125718 [Cantharellus anzutake]KAF8328938.1 hypothetical protein EI90DRAFT_3125718 [Cantharellus anzutake]
MAAGNSRMSSPSFGPSTDRPNPHYSHAQNPAIERWVSMRENVYQHFRFTPVKTRQVVGLMVIVPAFCGLLAYATDVCAFTIFERGRRAQYDTLFQNKFDWAGKKKNDSLLRTPASSQD